MGRTVVGDENQLQAQIDIIFRSGSAVQIGLLVGRLGDKGSRDMVFSLVPTPERDGEESATIGLTGTTAPGQGSSRRGNRGKAPPDSAPMLVITDWVSEHARQVSRMLVGGMRVVGVYAFASEGTFKSSLSILWQAVMAVAASTSTSVDAGETSDSLLLHIASSPRRLSCRSLSKGSTFSTTLMHPCEWKLGRVLSNLHSFSCTYNVDIRYPVVVNDGNADNTGLRDDISSAIKHEADRLRNAIAIVDGSTVSSENLPGSGSTSHDVELLLPFNGGAQVQPSKPGSKMLGEVVYKGAILVRAYGVAKEPVSRAVTDLKGDIVTSLRARLDLLVDEAEQAADEAKLRNEDSVLDVRPDAVLISHLSADDLGNNLVMPRRVFVPWHEGIVVSDYMLPGETFEDVKERIIVLIGVGQKPEALEISESEDLGTIPHEETGNHQIRSKDADPDVTAGKTAAVRTKTALSDFTHPSMLLVVGFVLVIAVLLAVPLFQFVE